MSQEGIEVLVSMLTGEEAEELGLSDESAECAAAGIDFVNVAIPDRSVPSDTNAFLRSVEQLATRVPGSHQPYKRRMESAKLCYRLLASTNRGIVISWHSAEPVNRG